jgi:hypothetical protein|tara:strand:+ start:13500 stop:15173 length:1674 start_codon:yes stop_codon:yes gene_type:complete
MAFRFVSPAASGSIQTLVSRAIDDPETIVLTDTPSTDSPAGQTGLNAGNNLSGSLQSIQFDGLDDHLLLPTSAGVATQFLLEDIGNLAVKHGSSANNIMFETWLKLSSSHTGTTNQFWEATIQRNSTSSTTGFDGLYSSRLVFASSGGGGDANFLTSGHFVDFQFASGGHMAWSLTSSKSIIPETWVHVITSYTSGETAATSKMQIWVDGILDREQTLAEMTGLALGGETDILPSTGTPLGARTIGFGGKLDEMRMWLNSGTTTSINPLSTVSSLGIVAENMASHVSTQFGPSAEYLAAWYRFEGVSAAEIFSGIADSIEDSTQYNHHATPKNFLGSVDFSEDQTIVYGVSATGDFLALKGGSVDHGGMLVFDNLDGSIVLEEGIQNLVVDASNTWTASGSANLTVDENQIWVGSSGYRVNTSAAGQGAKHNINYNPQFLFNENTYTMGIRLLSSTGSASARVVFTIGHHTNSAATTAVMTTTYWEPIYLTKSISADANETVITGSVSVQQLHNGGTDSGALFNLDGFMLYEGDFPSKFTRPDRIRKSGQIYWDIGD